ncbi:hypothetical protein NGM07_13285 [Halorussus vallis]|uniref:hypothetical protein n=1 Tax=Halorussus vallis TaxID=2953749 RepID=UPI00209FD601|nr:hypothetical protein [Halorussus vallis]USZ74416.1 hypothetical protein NGM07_13285 [Halorussus vallis]
MIPTLRFDALPDRLAERPRLPDRIALPRRIGRARRTDRLARTEHRRRTPRGDERAADEAAADPRLNAEYTLTVPGTGDDHDVTLVGAVHDHPASVYRAREVVSDREPAAVALEIPPLALPLYLNYAEDARTPPAFGGEMSAAAQAARECDADVVGVDAPRRGFLARLVRNCRREAVSAGTLRRVLSGTASVTRHALACRAVAVLGDRTGLRVEVDSPVEHDCDRTDPPEVQARDERRQADRSLSLLRAFDPPRPVELRDATREECMADRIRSLRRDGDVVAVVGLDHLDGLSELLEEEASA